MPNPRRRSGNNDNEGETDVPPEQLSRLIDRYKIRFLKYNQNWPEEYMEIFKDIKRIGCEQYATYQPNEDRDDLTVAQTRARVFEVVHAANRDYESRSNEQTLRLHTEPLVFKRFESEVSCRKCRRQLWTSEYAVRSNLPAHVERIRSHRTDIEVCRCALIARYEGTIIDNGNTSLFSDRCSAQVEHDKADEIPGYPIPCRLPDRIFGLNVTDSIKHYTQQVRGLRYHPFPSTDNMAYPFLISEAKPGVQNPGFESIDAQTAFPIRSCLMLQKRLREASRVDIDPLVWYMPYQGDVWKLKACIIREDEIQIYDLWMGCTQDPDGALQLLHLVDYIIQWARHTFRDTVLACLASGRHAVQRQIPVPENVIRSQTTLAQGSVQSLSQALETISSVSITTTTNNLDDSGASILTSTNSQVSSRNSPSTGCSQDVVDLTGVAEDSGTHAILRHPCRVRFEFVHASLPDNTDELKRFLKKAFSYSPTTEELKRKARWLSQLLSSPNHAVPLSEHQVSRLSVKWLNTPDRFLPGCLLTSKTPVKTLIQLDSELDSCTWTAVRRISCITCSRRAARCLMRLTGRTDNSLARRVHQDPSLYSRVRDELMSTAHLPSDLSALAALRNWSIDLQFDGMDTSYKWKVALDDISVFLPSARSEEGPVGDRNFIPLFHEVNVRDVRSKPASSRISQLIGPVTDSLDDALLLRKPDHWPESTAEWCLLTLKERNLPNGVSAAWKLMLAIDRGQVYIPQIGKNKMDTAIHTLDQRDVVSIEGWTQILTNEDEHLPEGTSWRTSPEDSANSS